MVFHSGSKDAIEIQLEDKTYYVPKSCYTPDLEYQYGIPPLTSQVAIVVYADGSEYHGSIQQNLRHGSGSMRYADGGVYTGNWQNNGMDNNAVASTIDLVVNNGRYTGAMFGGLMHGQGELVFQNKDSYVGTFEHGEFNGQGTYTYYDTNDVYEGTWLAGKRDGYGKFTYSNGSQYKGQWHDDKMHGQGTSTYPAMGSKYEGNHVDGRFHGQGTYTWKDGTTFSGNWEDGQMLDGTLQYKSGKTVKLNEGHDITFSFLHAPTVSPTVQAESTTSKVVESDSKQL